MSTSPPASIRLAIVEDHQVFRESLYMMIEPYETEISVVGEALNAHDAVQLVRRTAIDVLLCDLQMPARGRSLEDKSCRHGLAALREIVALPAAPQVVVLSKHDDELAYLFAVMQLGVNGYLAKRDELDSPALVSAIRRVARGEQVYSGLVRQAFRRLETLSRQEQRIFELLAARATNDQIAERLNITINTVKTHVGNILTKLELRSREEIPPRDDPLVFDDDLA